MKAIFVARQAILRNRQGGSQLEPPIDIYDMAEGRIVASGLAVQIDGPSEMRYTRAPLLCLEGGREIQLALVTEAPIRYTEEEDGEWHKIPAS